MRLAREGVTSRPWPHLSEHLSPEHAPPLAGLELAFDFHKWGQVPYDAGFLLVREPRGVAAGEPWFADYGADLSRGFRALEVWFTLKTFGLDRPGGTIGRLAIRVAIVNHRCSEADLTILADAIVARARSGGARAIHDDSSLAR